MFGTELRYEYKGYQYRTYDDVEDDNIKTFHFCFKDGQEVFLCDEFYQTSPYRKVHPEDFKRFVDPQILVDFVKN